MNVTADSRHLIFFILMTSLGVLQQVASEKALRYRRPSVSERGTEESFTCEWESKTLTCPTGQGIVIDFANYGRTTHPVCVIDPVRDAPKDCYTPSHTNFVATFCNGKSDCVVPATNLFFGDTCPNVFKYLQIKYHCETLTPTEIDESFTCEWESKTLTCPSGKSIIVDYANYGRTTHPVCVIDPVRDKPTNCFTASHTDMIGNLCNGQSNCVIPATNSFFGDTCPNVFKYLHIKYHCACPSADVVESFTCEWESKTLTCPSGKSIVIDFANYGRTTHKVCVIDPVRDAANTCSTAAHTDMIGQRCNGKSSCVVPATNSFFGDTCPNVFKYLQIKYHCA